MKQPMQPPEMQKRTITRTPSADPWNEARAQIAGKTGAPTARLQCRSFPPGVDIIIDGKHTEQVTPYTFNNLKEGDHEIEMQYVDKDGEVIAKKETVNLKIGKRIVCKMHFVKPKTLA